MANRTPTSDTDQTQPLAARPPTGDGADPTPAGTPGDAVGTALETVDAGAASQIGDGSGAAGAGRPSRALVPRPGAGGVELGPDALPVSVAPAGRRLAGLGISAPQFLTVLHRIYQGRTQRRLDHYLIHARVLGASDREARLVLAAVEETVLVAQPVDRLDPFDLAAEVLTRQLAGMLVRLGSDGGGS